VICRKVAEEVVVAAVSLICSLDRTQFPKLIFRLRNVESWISHCLTWETRKKFQSVSQPQEIGNNEVILIGDILSHCSS
jgi:hypothetical protein